VAVTRRAFMAGLGVVGAGGLSQNGAGSLLSNPRGRHLILLHTNDIHGHVLVWQGWEGTLKGRAIGGLDRLASAIKSVRSSAPDRVLLLDAGDLWSDTMIAALTRGEALVDLVNHLRYDALTVGNHEPDYGGEVMAERIKQAHFPVVAANLLRTSSGKLLTKPYVVRDVAGVRVGILGLAYQKTPWTTAPKNVEDLTFLDPVGAVRDHLPKMQQEGAQISIVLSHLGLHGDQHLATQTKGVDVIVGGHSHNRIAEPIRVGKTLIVQAGAHGSDLGRLDLTVQDGRITSHHYTLTLLDHAAVPTDPETAKLVEHLIQPHRQTMNERIGTAAEWLVRAQTIAGGKPRKRDEQSPIDLLFADILRAVTGADIALLPGVGYGVAIAPGAITAAALRQLLPHDGKIVTMELRGSAVREILEQSLENVHTEDPAEKVGGMIQVSGLRFTYDAGRKQGDRILELHLDNAPFEPEASYLIATNAMMAQGGHRYHTLTQGENQRKHGAQFETTRDWIRAQSPGIFQLRIDSVQAVNFLRRQLRATGLRAVFTVPEVVGETERTGIGIRADVDDAGYLAARKTIRLCSNRPLRQGGKPGSVVSCRIRITHRLGR
jgi:5'-nucleotidase / UDP-sugar diphosphatase